MEKKLKSQGFETQNSLCKFINENLISKIEIDFSKEIMKCYKFQYPEQNLKYARLICNARHYGYTEWKDMMKTYDELMDTLKFLIKLIHKLEKNKK